MTEITAVGMPEKRQQAAAVQSALRAQRFGLRSLATAFKAAESSRSPENA